MVRSRISVWLLMWSELDLADKGPPQAAKHPATSRSQWAQWTKLWPISWLAPSISGANIEVKLSAAAVVSMHSWMHRTLQEAEKGQQHGSAYNAALVVNPETSEDCGRAGPFQKQA